MNPFTLLRLAAAPLLACVLHVRADSVVVFNEIMYHPAPDAAPATGEWIELQNQMAVDIDLSGWRLAGGVEFAFPEGTVLAAGGFLVIAESPSLLTAAGVSGALGPWTGKLDNKGERVTLLNNSARVMDEVDYEADGEWPVAPDGGGVSLARRAKFTDTRLPASWRASRRTGGTPGVENFPASLPPVVTPLLTSGAVWKYDNSGVDRGQGWRATDYDDSAWPSGAAAFQLGAEPLPPPAAERTALVSGPVVSYFRTRFSFAGNPRFTTLTLRALVDDGAVFYLNGERLAALAMPEGEPAFNTPATAPVNGPPVFRELTVPAGALRNGENVLAAEVRQAGPQPSYAGAVLGSGPVAYWRLDETSGPARNAVSEAGELTGEYMNFAETDRGQAGPRPADTVDGQAPRGFEEENAAPLFRGNGGGGDDVILIEDPGALNFSAGRAFTLEAWARGPAAQESGAAILCKGSGAGGEQYCVDVEGGFYRFYVRSGSGNPAVVTTTVRPDNTWQHLAAVYDQAAGIMRLYVNGARAGSSSGTLTSLRNVADPVSIGARKSSAQSGYDLNFDGSIDEVAVYNRALGAAEILAHYQSAFVLAAGGVDTTDAVFDLEVNAVETTPADAPASPYIINEVSLSGIEFMNTGAMEASLSGCWRRIVGDNLNLVNGFAAVPRPPGHITATTAFLDPGMRVLLFAPDGKTLLDAVKVRETPRARYPDGSGPWLIPDRETLGEPNAVTLRDEIVINEIMYDPPDAALTPLPAARAGQWIEFYNKSSQTVSLDGWSVSCGIRFAFPAGASLAPGGYAVLAENPSAFRAAHPLPNGTVFGPWERKLSKSKDVLVLNDARGNPADEVRYFSEGRWPVPANGGGSSLELRDPLADNNVAESWAASDESARASWQTFAWRGVNRASQPGEPTLWKELNLLLVDGPGECLVDDVKVIDTVTGADLIQNGDFSQGAAHWRFLGTHRHSRVEPEPANAGNSVLRVVANGPGEYQGNQIESTFLNNRSLTANREYEISLRARWLNGGGRLNTRLYFNRLPKTNLLNVVSAGGTPGAPNSQALPNAGPVFQNLTHAPVVPAANQPVTVSVDATDPQGVASLTLWYSVNGGAWQSAAMSAGADGGRFSGVIPGTGQGVVQFHVEGRDAAGASAFFPAAGPDSRAFYAVEDGQASGSLPTVRVVMAPADSAFLHTDVNTLSNEYLGATVIADGRDVYYDAGARLKGSFVGRNVARVGFTLRFNSDRLFRGIHDKAAIDRSQHAALGQGELVLKYMAGRAGGIPNMYDDVTRFIHPDPKYTAVAQLRLTAFEDEFLDTQYPDGADGTMFEMEVHRWNLTTVDGNPESLKKPGNEGSGTGYNNVELADFGEDPEAYRWNLLQTKDRDRDDYSAAVALSRMFSKSGAAFDAEANTRLDNESWLRTLAFQSLMGVADAAYTGGAVHNFRLYFTLAGRAVYLPWDWDSAYQLSTSAPLIGGGNIAKTVTATPDRRRRYHWHLHDLIGTAFNADYMRRWTEHYGTVTGENYAGILNYIRNRAAYVRARLPSAAFAANAGAVDGNGFVTLTGAGGIGILFIEVNGVARQPVWTSNTAWTLSVPLNPGANRLTVRGVDKNGAPLEDATAVLEVHNPHASVPPALRINEWMADNQDAAEDPADGRNDDWFELYNPADRAVDLAGWRLTDDPANPGAAFVIPAGWSVPPKGFLLVWADGEPSQNPVTPVAGSALHVPFKLGASGESIALFAPDGGEIDRVTFGPQTADVSEGRYPDGAADWRALTAASPGGANVRAEFLRLDLQSPAPEVEISATPGWSYQLEASSDLRSWSPVSEAVQADGASSSVKLPAPSGGAVRYFRVRVTGR